MVQVLAKNHRSQGLGYTYYTKSSYAPPMLPREVSDATLPVRLLPGEKRPTPQKGMALCLSGGGYRATLFHVGALWRLNELGLLPKLARISSVSGGSITAGFLGLQWSALAFNRQGVAENFEQVIAEPLRDFTSVTIDIPDVVMGAALPGHIPEYVETSYRGLFGNATLQDLPDEAQGPRFMFNATNVQTTALWRFSREFMGDYRVGRVERPTTSLAFAVAASSAFPPFLSPARLRLNPKAVKRTAHATLHRPPFTTQALLTDGGVYDNLGLETCWKKYKTILVSDACAPMDAAPAPGTDWPRQSYRLILMIQNQVQALRKRQLIGSYARGARSGAYWGIASKISHFPVRGHLRVPAAWSALADVPTRLAKIAPITQERLINWGYAIADAGLRAHVFKGAAAPRAKFPYA
jgi:NTE family protein